MWTDETWYFSFVEIAAGVLTPTRFFQVALFPEHKRIRTGVWLEMCQVRDNILFVIRLKHFSDTFFPLLPIYSLSLMISNCRQNHCFREILESPLLGGHSKWSYWAMVLRHLFDRDYLYSFLSPILSHYAIIPWDSL